MTARDERYAEFTAATAGVCFVKDFCASLDAIMRDPEADVRERVRAWRKRKSWGNFSLYCVTDDHSRVAIQEDCARDLGLDKSIVSRANSYDKARGYLRCEGKVMYPVISPTVQEVQKVADCATFEEFTALLKVADYATFEAWQKAEEAVNVAKSALEPLRKVVLSAFCSWRRQQQKGPHPIDVLDLTTVDKTKNDERPSPTQVDSPAPEPVRPFVVPPREEISETASPEPVPIRVELRDWLTGLTEWFGLETAPDDAALDLIAAHVTTPEILGAFERQIEKQHPRPGSGGWKYFVPIAESAAKTQSLMQNRKQAASAQTATKCERCRGSGRHPLFVQEDCDACRGTGMPDAELKTKGKRA